MLADIRSQLISPAQKSRLRLAQGPDHQSIDAGIPPISEPNPALASTLTSSRSASDHPEADDDHGLAGWRNAATSSANSREQRRGRRGRDDPGVTEAGRWLKSCHARVFLIFASVRFPRAGLLVRVDRLSTLAIISHVPSLSNSKVTLIYILSLIYERSPVDTWSSRIKVPGIVSSTRRSSDCR